jgi:signal transduction histidine kinase
VSIRLPEPGPARPGPAVHGGDPPAHTADDFWTRHAIVWHLVAGVNAALVAVLILTDDGPSRSGRIFGLAILLGLAGWYALVGRRALAGSDTRRGLAYLSVALVGYVLLLVITPAAGFLLFTLNPQLFTMVTRWRLRLPAMLILYGATAAADLGHHGFTRAALVDALVWALVPLVGAVLIGSFITGVIQQSRQRAALIDELVRTRAELARERHDAGVRDERERLAAEIHDTIAQGCTSILMLSQAARASLLGTRPDEVGPEAARPDGVRPEVARQLDLIERTARDNLAETRALIAALAPPDLSGRGLPDALSRLAERFTRETGVPARASVAGRVAGATPDIDVALLRAAQESLANVRKHAHARRVHIRLSRIDGTAVLTVNDDGCGFDPERAGDGYGLAGIRARAAALGGVCTVRSAPGAGTTVRVELPDPAGSGGAGRERPAVAR